MAHFCRTGFKRVVHLLGIVGLLACQGLSQAGPGGSAARSRPPGISPGSADIQADKSNDSRRLKEFGRLPLSFEANTGQTDSRIKFLARGPGYTLFLRSNEATFGLIKKTDAGRPSPVRRQPVTGTESSVVRVRLEGAAPNARGTSLEPRGGTSSYFIGNDRSNWRTAIPHYGRIRFRDVYPGIDIVYYGNQQRLEFDFELRPGADPGRISLGFEGVDTVRLDPQGDLVLQTAAGELRQHRPRVYQQVDGAAKAVEGAYVLNGKRQARFKLGAYDPARPLTIDPVISYATYLGGDNSDIIYGLATDTSGRTYITGWTFSANFPLSAGAYKTTLQNVEAFVSLLDTTGTALVFSTFLGGSSSDYARGIAIDSSGNPFITGYTLSTNFPTTAGAPQTVSGGSADAFVAKLNNTGTALLYSTYLGGSGTDWGLGIAVDTAGNASVCGYTDSANFPTASPFQAAPGGSTDAFVTKVNSSGTLLVYSTYLGGSSFEEGLGVAVDSAQNTYITGYTFSNNFPTTAGALKTTRSSTDAFVTKLNPAGSALVYSTFLGGSSSDYGYGIAVDPAGHAYLTGYTSSTDFPVSSGALQEKGFAVAPSAIAETPQAAARLHPDNGLVEPGDEALSPVVQGTSGGNYDAYVAKLNPAGSALVYATYLGGNNNESGYGISVDLQGRASVTGYTGSGNFPTAYPTQASFGSTYGVYGSTNGGATWTISNNGMTANAFYRVAINPTNPNIRFASAYQRGIYRTTNGGATWTLTLASSGIYTGDLAISPVNPNTVYATNGCNGLVKSTDGGATWTDVTIPDYPCAQSVTVDPTNANTVYAGSYYGVYKSTNGGASWTAMNTGLPAPYPQVQELLIAPSSPSILYALLYSSGVYKSTDGGANWTAMNTGLTASYYPITGVVDPTNPAIVYLSSYNGTFKSTDGAATWTRSASYIGNGMAIDAANPSNVYAAVSGGVLKTTNGGSSWTLLSSGMSPRPYLFDVAVAASNPSIVCAALYLEPDAFVATLNPSGTALLFSTYLGGPSYDVSYAVTSDTSGNVVVGGDTNGWPGFPAQGASPFQATAPGGLDGILVKFAIETPPPATTLISPSGSISTSTPPYVWNAVASATWYQLWVTDSDANPKIQTWYTAAQAGCASGTGTCSVTPATELANGAATWWIQTWNSSGYGPWSDGLSFTVSAGGPPGKATLVSPSGIITTATPSYVWNAVSNSTWYQLWVTDSAANPKIQTWYTAADAGCASGTGTCTITPTTALADGAATWWIQTWNSSGYGPWSDGLSFTVSAGVLPGKATLVSPSGSITTATPTYVWNVVSNSTWYQLWVTDSALAPKIQVWYTAVDAGCALGTGTCSVTPLTAVANGTATWWIQTWNGSGYGPWSDGMAFTVTAASPGQPTSFGLEATRYGVSAALQRWYRIAEPIGNGGPPQADSRAPRRTP